jgi:hypothetical protein
VTAPVVTAGGAALAVERALKAQNGLTAQALGIQRAAKAETIEIRNAAGVMVAQNVDPAYACAIRAAVERQDREQERF